MKPARFSVNVRADWPVLLLGFVTLVPALAGLYLELTTPLSAVGAAVRESPHIYILTEAAYSDVVWYLLLTWAVVVGLASPKLYMVNFIVSSVWYNFRKIVVYTRFGLPLKKELTVSLLGCIAEAIVLVWWFYRRQRFFAEMAPAAQESSPRSGVQPGV